MISKKKMKLIEERNSFRQKYLDLLKENELLEKELENYKSTQEGELINYISNTVKQVRDLDYSVSNSICERGIDNENFSNQFMKYGLGLRSVLNFLYSKFSSNSGKQDIENLKKFGIKVKTIDNLIQEESKPLNLNIKGDYLYAEKALAREFYTFYNKRISRFPVKFKYGLRDDETVN